MPGARAKRETVPVENPNSPGRVTNLDAAKYGAMKAALLAVIPQDAPGIAAADLRAAVISGLPTDLFPGGEKAGWWVKAVQLDLEAKGVLKRAPRPPVRLHQV